MEVLFFSLATLVFGLLFGPPIIVEYSVYGVATGIVLTILQAAKGER